MPSYFLDLGFSIFQFSEIALRFPLTLLFNSVAWLLLLLPLFFVFEIFTFLVFSQHYLSQFVSYLYYSISIPLVGFFASEMCYSLRLSLWPKSNLFLVISFSCQLLLSCLWFSYLLILSFKLSCSTLTSWNSWHCIKLMNLNSSSYFQHPYFC